MGALVAVVIPCRDYGRFLADAVDSALAQTVPPAAVVVVDDGSTDDTPAVAALYGGRIRYLRLEGVGVSEARNLGARDLTSDYVVFLDADDVLSPDYIEATLAALAGDPGASYAYTDMERFGAQAGVSEARPWSVRALARSNFVHASALLPVELVRRHPYRAAVGTGLEDWDLYLTLAESGHRGVHVPRSLLRYRHHEGGRTRALRQHPFHLAALRLRLAVHHRRLYSPLDAVAYAGHVGGQLWTDLNLVDRARRALLVPGRADRLRRRLRF